MNITGSDNQIKAGNREYITANIDSRLTEEKKSKDILKATSKSSVRVEQDRIRQDVNRDIVRYMSKDSADPYDNTPQGKKAPRDKVLAISNSQYTASLLEKILKASDNSQFQSTTLKFQEQALNYMQNISADIKSIAELLKPKTVEAEEEDNDLKMEVSKLAKAVAELNVEGIAKEVGAAIFKKMDSNGYGSLIQTMYGSLRDTIKGGDFTSMVKGMIQSQMLKQLPKEMQQTIQEFRDDPVVAIQKQINKLGSSNNRVLRDIFGSSYGKMNLDTQLREKKMDMSAKALFDNKFYTAVTKVIPEQLYRIVSALEGNEIRAYDWEEQKYVDASELAAKAAKNNQSMSYETLQDRTMQVFSYMFEQAFEKHSGRMGNIFRTNGDGTLMKDQISGTVQFNSGSMKEILTKMMLSKMDKNQIVSANPAWIIRQIGITTNDPVRLGAYYDDVSKIQLALKMSDFDDRTDALSDLDELRASIHSRFKDTRTDFLRPSEQALYDRVIFANNLTAAQKNNIINSIGRRGIHVWGNGIGGGNGGSNNYASSNSGGSYGPNNPGGSIQGASTNTHYDYLMDVINTSDTSGTRLTPRELDDARKFIDDLAMGKRTSFKKDKESQPTPQQSYAMRLADMVKFGVISETDRRRFATSSTERHLIGNDAAAFRAADLRLRRALETYKILQEAGYTADAQAARLGVSVQEATRMGYISSPNELIGAINPDGTFNPQELRDRRLTYLQGDDFEFVRRVARENRQSALGSGSIDKQISNVLSGIFGDPTIAGKAGFAVGSAAGLGINKLLKDAGIVSSPKFGYLLAGVGGSLMSMQRVRGFMNNVFGPEGDIKGANGFSNKEIFLAKAMSKYLPAIGVGGKTASMIMKASAAFGPLGKAFGLIAGPILGYGIGMASSSLIDKGRDWLFNKERDPNSKIAKFANFLKDIPGVKKLFALSDTRSQADLHLDSLNKLEAFYTSRLMAYRATENPSPSRIRTFQRAIEEIRTTKNRVASLISRRDSEASKEDSDQEMVQEYENQISAAIASLDSVLDGFTAELNISGSSERQALYQAEEDEQNSQNRMRAAADASYNKPSEDHLEAVNDIVTRYWDTDNEHKKTMRDVISGESSTLYDTISDEGMRREFRQMVLRSEAGEDVSNEYRSWKQRLRRHHEADFQEFSSIVGNGGSANRLKEELLQLIMNHMRYNENFTGTEEELRYHAQNRMMGYLNNRGMAGHFNKMVGDAGGSAFSRLKAIFGGALDDEDALEQQRAIDMATAFDNDGAEPEEPLSEAELRREANPNGGNNPPNNGGPGRPGTTRGAARRGGPARARRGRGGRGDKPIKMKSLINQRFKSGEDLSIAGCSIAAITNALVYMGLDAPEPSTLIEIANKYLTADGGVTSQFMVEVCTRLGVKVSIYNRNQNKFTSDTLKVFKPGNGQGLVLLLANLHNPGYHYVTIKAISGNRVTVDDPEETGLSDVTVADMISRAVEIIHLQTSTETSGLKESAVTQAVKAKMVVGKDNQIGLATKAMQTAAGIDMSDVKAGAVTAAGGAISTATGSLAKLISALENAVINVRVVDDLTLPLKMGDPDAALSISKQQLAASTTPGVKAFATRIKKMMMGKDVQAELRQENLVQEAILNGGLVAGGSTGVGGRGTAATAANTGGILYNGGAGGNADVNKPGGSLWDRAKSGAAGALLKLASAAGVGISGGAQYLAAKLSSPMLQSAKRGLTLAYNNLFGDITPEEAQQKFDENGQQIDPGKFRDIGGSMRVVRDSINIAKGAVAVHGVVGAGIGKLGTVMAQSGSKILTPVGKALTGSTKSTLVNTFVKAMTVFPAKIADMLLRSDILARVCGGEKVVKTMVETYIDPMKDLFKKIGSKLASALADKGGKALAKQGLLAKAKGLLSKVPILDALILLPSIGFSAYTGYKEAHRYLKKAADKVSALCRFGMAIAKTIYDNGMDLVLAIAANIMPVLRPLKTIASILLGVFRSIVTFPMLLKIFGFVDENANQEVNSTEKKVEQQNKDQSEQDLKATEKSTQKAKSGDVTTEDSSGSTPATNSTVSSSSYSKPVEAGSYASKVLTHEFTAQHEGFVDHVYKDSKGFDTIGYGFNIDSGRFSKEQVNRWRRDGITKDEANKILNDELSSTRNQLTKFDWFNKLDPVRQGAIVDMSYNMGIGWINKFPKAIAAIKSGDYETASREIMSSKYARDVGQRATRIAELIRTGGEAGTQAQAGQPTPAPENYKVGGANGWAHPIKGTIMVTSAFGPRNVPGASNPHRGIDLRGNFGDPVLAAKDGVVTEAGGEYGTISIEHDDGTKTRYLHNDTLMVKIGDRVTKGQQIATVGGRGPKGKRHYRPHLHFEVWKGQKRVDPFIELGLTKEQLKLPPKYPKSESLENIAYVQRNKWLLDKAKSDVENNNKMMAVDTNQKSTNKEAGGPDASYDRMSHGVRETIVKYEDAGLAKEVRSLSEKFDQMISLLSEIVKNTNENSNKIMSEAFAPAKC